MKYQRVKLNPLAIMSRNNGPHDGAGVTFTGDADNLPPLPNGEAWVVVEDRPTAGENQRVERDLTAEKYGWKLVDMTKEEIAARAPVDIGVTPQVIIERMVGLGKWATFKALLEDETRIPDYIPAIFYSAQRIRKTNPMFVAFGGLFKTELGLTDEEFDEILTTDEI